MTNAQMQLWKTGKKKGTSRLYFGASTLRLRSVSLCSMCNIFRFYTIFYKPFSLLYRKPIKFYIAMKTLKLLLAICFCANSICAFCQQENEKQDKKLKLSGFNVESNFLNLGYNYKPSSFQELKEDVEGNSLNDISDSADYWGSNMKTRFKYEFGFNMIFKIPDSKYNSEVRLGISYYTGNRNFDYYKLQSSVLDTSYMYGDTVHVDQYVSETYDFEESINELSVNGAYLVKTNPDKRFYFFTGVELKAGISIKSPAKFFYKQNISTITVNNYGYCYYGTHPYLSDSDKRYYTPKSNIFIMSILPVGMNFRMSKKDNMLSHFNATLRINAGLAYKQVSGGNRYFSTLYGFGAGIKYNI